MDDELLDLVNENDVVIGTINRKDYKQLLAEDKGYVRASNLFIVNSEGKLYVPIRTADKTIAPNGYDYSVGGHVGSGNDYLSTIIRESKEELNIDVQKDEVILIEKTVSNTMKYIYCVYLMYRDETPVFNPDDFVSADWLYPDELISGIDKGHPTKNSLKDSVIVLKEYLESNK